MWECGSSPRLFFQALNYPKRQTVGLPSHAEAANVEATRSCRNNDRFFS